MLPRPFSLKNWNAIWVLGTIFVTIWLFYFFFGQQLIAALHNTQNSWLADKMMRGRSSTPIEAYYRRADAALVHLTILAFVTYGAIRILLRKGPELLLFLFSPFATASIVFLCLETFPSLIPLTHLDRLLGYYAYKVNYIPDPELVFTEKPFNRRIIRDFAGMQHSLRYGIREESYDIEWIMDKDGFRNHTAADSAQLVVMGDSYIEYGATEEDTFVGRLQKKLPQLTARNLGKSGYSVGQYVGVLERFGVKYRPKVALIAIYEGNDIPEIRDYLIWKSGGSSELRGFLFKFSNESLWRRYIAAISSTFVQTTKAARAIDEVALARLATIRGYAPQTHPEMAVINLNDRVYPKLFVDKLPELTVDKLRDTEEFRTIERFFTRFREVCQQNGIAPIIVYIPTALQVYAPYTTLGSGSEWLHLRDRQLAVRQNTESAIKGIAEKSRLEFISLTPLFEAAAAKGIMLYYALDEHWNSEGREIAADYIARLLKERFPAKS
jgi:hypothetical protein